MEEQNNFLLNDGHKFSDNKSKVEIESSSVTEPTMHFSNW